MLQRRDLVILVMRLAIMKMPLLVVRDRKRRCQSCRGKFYHAQKKHGGVQQLLQPQWWPQGPQAPESRHKRHENNAKPSFSKQPTNPQWLKGMVIESTQCLKAHGVWCAMCDVRCAMCDVRCAMCDARCAMHDARTWLVGTDIITIIGIIAIIYSGLPSNRRLLQG
jgi:hypothetical protein